MSEEILERLKNCETTKDMLDRMQKNPESFRYTIRPTPPPEKPAPAPKKVEEPRPKSFFEVLGIMAFALVVLTLLKRLFL